MVSCNFTVPSPEYLSTADVRGWTEGNASTTTFSLRKDGPGIFSGLPEGVLDLDRVLQYGMSTGFDSMMQPLEEVKQLVHGKAISDASVFLTLGCTDGVSKTFLLFCEPVSLCDSFFVSCLTEAFLFISFHSREIMSSVSSTPSVRPSTQVEQRESTLFLSRWTRVGFSPRTLTK